MSTSRIIRERGSITPERHGIKRASGVRVVFSYCFEWSQMDDHFMTMCFMCLTVLCTFSIF